MYMVICICYCWEGTLYVYIIVSLEPQWINILTSLTGLNGSMSLRAS